VYKNKGLEKKEKERILVASSSERWFVKVRFLITYALDGVPEKQDIKNANTPYGEV